MAREHQGLVHQPTALVGAQDTRLVSPLQHTVSPLSAWPIHTMLQCTSGKSFGAVVTLMGKAGVVSCTLARQPMQAVGSAQVCVP